MSDFYDWLYLDSYEDYRDSEPEVLENIIVLHETGMARLIACEGSCAWFPKSISTLEDKTLIFENWFTPEWKKTTNLKMGPIEGDFQ